MKMNRLQNRVELLFSDVADGKCNTILTEKAEAYVEVENDKWSFLSESEDFLWMSEMDGFMHVYRYSRVHFPYG